MKHILRDVLIFKYYVTGVTCMYFLFAKRRGPLVRVVVFHDVRDATWFLNCCTYMQQRYHVVTPEEYLSADFHPTKINILITFDDGYASWVTVCLPVLASCGIQALFFINSGLIDSSGSVEESARYVRERLLLSPRDILSWDGVRALVAGGQTIGGHSTTHARLSELHKDMQRREVELDKKRIEEKLGIKIKTFAYPFGQSTDYTPVTKNIVARAGYDIAFSTHASFVETGDAYAHARLCIPDDLTISKLRYWIEGGYDLYAKLKKLCVG